MGRAGYYKHGNNNVICDRCGFKFKADQVKEEWNGLYTCLAHCWEQRHPQDLIRSKHDNQRPGLSRPGGSDIFVKPIANAGFDQNVGSFALVNLDGSRSKGQSAIPLTYQWIQISGTPVTLSSATVAKPTFSAPVGITVGEVFVFSLVVADVGTQSLSDTVQITVVDVTWDVRGIALSGAHIMPNVGQGMYSLYMEPTGTYLLWISMSAPDAGNTFMNRVTMAVPWDITSIIDNSWQTRIFNGISWGFVFIKGGMEFISTRIDNTLERWTLGAPYELNPLSFAESVPAQMITRPTGISISPDGNRLHLSEQNFGGLESHLQGFTLNNFDLSTLIKTVGDITPVNVWPGQSIFQHYIRYDSGFRYYGVDMDSALVSQADLFPENDLTTAMFAGSGDIIQRAGGMFWRPDGSRIYISDEYDNTIRQFDVALGV